MWGWGRIAAVSVGAMYVTRVRSLFRTSVKSKWVDRKDTEYLSHSHTRTHTHVCTCIRRFNVLT